MPRDRPTSPPLDPSDRSLWEKVAEQAKPLRQRPHEGAKTGPGPELPQSRRKLVPEPPRSKTEPVGAAPPRLGTIDRRLTQRLGRGLRKVDARIDLHGMRQNEAREVLYAFLARAQAKGSSLVLAITGKGTASGHEEAGFMPNRDAGVLRQAVPQWLALPRFRPLVVGFTPAHRRHGGEGALYVQIRRPKRSSVRE